MESSDKLVFLRSLRRCQDTGDFLDRFYDKFIASSEEIEQRFRFTNFDLQKVMLLRSLEIASGAAEGKSDALAELRERSQTHDRDHLDIRPVLYELWLDALINTAKDSDKEWNDRVENAWNKILGHVIKFMISKH